MYIKLRRAEFFSVIFSSFLFIILSLTSYFSSVSVKEFNSFWKVWKLSIIWVILTDGVTFGIAYLSDNFLLNFA